MERPRATFQKPNVRFTHHAMKRRPHLPVKNHTLRPSKRRRQAAWLLALAASVCIWQGVSDLGSGLGWMQFSLGLALGAPSLFFAGRSQEVALIAPRKDVAVTEKWFLDLWQVTYPVTPEAVITILRQESDPHLARVMIELKDPETDALRPVYLDRGPQRYPRAVGTAREAALYLDVPVRELQGTGESVSAATRVLG